MREGYDDPLNRRGWYGATNLTVPILVSKDLLGSSGEPGFCSFFLGQQQLII